MRILHLAYEDPSQPGSGGGSVRTNEINRRLSSRHQVTALVAGYPGAATRYENGIRWIPIGPHTGGKIDRLAYFGLLGPEVARRPHDLVVEDFGAPFSVGFSPLFTSKPVIASVQWLFANEMRLKYGLPFNLVERFGLKFYDDFIVVSDWLAGEVIKRRGRVTIETIPNGVEPCAFTVETQSPKHLLFVGRLDIEQKGGDLLLEIMARLAAALGQGTPPLLIVGDGPDRRAMEQLAHSLNVTHLVEFRGRIEGIEKYRLMASAYAVLMPSRFETFGMVAAESQAAGAPIVAFDVGPLADVAGAGGASLIPAFDLEAFAQEVAGFVSNPGQLERVRESGRQWARRYDWDTIANLQEQHYLRAVARPRSSDSRRMAVWRSAS